MHIMPRDTPEYRRRQQIRRSNGESYCKRNFHADHDQENNEMSGSRGEANFVWKCKNCKVRIAAICRERKY